MTLPQRSRNDQRVDRDTQLTHKVKATLDRARKREMRNFDNALRSRDIGALVDDPVDLDDMMRYM